MDFDSSGASISVPHMKKNKMNLNINKFWKKRSVTITEYDPTYKVVYLGNVLTAWAKGEGCVDKPLATLWKNYCQNAKPDVYMKVTVCNSGLKAVTKEHGLTEYWSNRITYCGAQAQYPRVFCWVYRHEGKKLRQELRCHAVLCNKEEMAIKMATQLQIKLAQALQEFKREKLSRQNARLSLANSVYDNPSLPRRKILLCTGSANYRPPVERSKSAPKLMVIEEVASESPDETLSSAGNSRSENDHRHRQVTFDTRNSCPDLLRTSPRNNERRRQRLRFLTDPLDQLDEDDDVIAHRDDDNDLDDIEVCLFERGTADADCNDDVIMDEAAYNSNPNPNGRMTPLAMTTRRRVASDDVISSSESSSTSSSPASLRLTSDVKVDDDTISDESGYSEENGVSSNVVNKNRLCSNCTI